ncbi:ERF family protein [Lactobacillus crispatus]|uniref:ERF family protein n=1 Tax=Lactobacillus crispatus TaxID=47770 RepID=UPI0011D28B38|nr:ERF family protein [Lactobacillus crispatus]
MLLEEQLKIENQNLKDMLADERRKDKASFALHLAMVKMKIEQPKKSHKVTVSLKSGGSYTYSYADLADVDKAIMKAIVETAVDGKPLLTYRFEIDNGAEGVSAETVIIDAATGYEERTNRVWFKNVNVGKAQDSASLISYAKRYSLSAAFGIASEDDDDAQAQIRNQEQIIDKAGIEIIVNEYLKDKTEKSKRWIKGKHDKATAEYIMQLIGKYKLDQHLENNKNKQIEKRKERHEKQISKKPKKVAAKSGDEIIKDIVDKPKDDSQVTAGQQDLFNSVLGE